MVKFRCACGRYLHGDECEFRNEEYYFGLWFCPYCRRISVVPDLLVSQEDVEKDIERMREANDKIMGLIEKIADSMEKIGFKVKRES